MQHIVLITRHFPELILAAMEDAIQQARALEENGRQFVKIADETIDDFYSSRNSSMIITEVSSQLLHDAVEQENVLMIKRIITFRNAYMKLCPEDAGYVQAAIDEHIPTKFQVHLR